ncbi:MAG: LPXTG cell wall anchor domain-containing protein, partial [bacterium]|nr:LPXTG cell wall anchor domain-containing protein [bacterium]
PQDPAPADPKPAPQDPATQNTSNSNKKVLPNTGETNSLLGFLGVAITSLGGLISFKRRQ